MSKIEIRSPDSGEEWEAYFQLRWKMLREPWQQPQGSEKDELEDSAIHFAAFASGIIIGVARLQRNSGVTGQIRYMATDSEYQNKGTGKLLVKEIERRARIMGLKKIQLNSRETAVGFYQKLGYTVHEKGHLLYNSIQHYVMTKLL